MPTTVDIESQRMLVGSTPVRKIYQGTNLLGMRIAELFAVGVPGVWYDPSDFSTMFQDSAGTTPVTAVEQPVGLMLDKSGNGNHASQPTATSRPVLRQDGNGKHYLYFDGVDDWLVTNTITPGIDKVQVFAGVRKLSDVGSMIAEFSSATSNPGMFYLVSGSDAGVTGYSSLGKGTASANTGHVAKTGTVIAPDTAVLSVTHDISSDLSTIRRNGAVGTNATADKGTGNYLAYPLYIGCRGGTTIPFNGHLYGLIVRFGANLPIATIQNIEKYINQKTRAY